MMYFWNILPILLAIPAQTMFLLIFSLKLFGAGEWWKVSIGRALFAKSVAITLVGIMLVIDFFYKVSHGSTFSFGYDPSMSSVLVISAFWVAAATIYYQLFVLIKTRKTEKKSK